MIKQEIIDKISKYFKLTHFEAEKIYEDIFSGIIHGVKEDNIADITNLGEFIIKYNNNGDTTYKKTVEFLPALSLEEEINQSPLDEHKIFESTRVTTEEHVVQTDNITQSTIESTVTESKSETSNLEEDIIRKREEILNKITTHPEQQTFEVPEIRETSEPPLVVPPLVVPPIVTVTETVITETKEEFTEKAADFDEKTPSDVEEIKETSFSDYFSEVKNEGRNIQDSANKNIMPPVENVIPPSAVELHQQITGDQANNNMNYQSNTGAVQYGSGNGNGNGNGYEHKMQDNSYYIWYKDSEPNINDTQTMSYEYELLYQATKEAEYKSKLRVYVTTFILFFSIVLLLLILSPVIYKFFFSPGENQNTEEVSDETSSNGVEPTTEAPSSQQNQASVNSLDNTNNATNNASQNNTTTGTDAGNSTTANQQPVTEQPKQEQPTQQPVTEQPKQQEPPKQETPKLDGVTKNSVGWMDDKNKVIYVQLENGKFTIQESAWDSDAKANKRLNAVGGIIPGLKGSVVKVDLGTKGTWYRTRLGEFSTIEEAKIKAEELRNKEKTRLHALLISFLLYA